MKYPEDYINKIICGDCLEVMKVIPDKAVDLILCDLPYGTTACKWDTIIPLDLMWEQYIRIIKNKGAIVLTASQPFTSVLVMSNIKWFKYEWIWEKSRSGSPLTAKYMPLKLHENIVVFCEGKTRTYNPQMTKGSPYSRNIDYKKGLRVNNHSFGIKGVHSNNLGNRFPTTIQKIKQNWSRQQQIHPTQKPVALFEYLIKTYTNENDIVLDNCIGSGTTAVACIKTKRNFIGIEKDDKYCEIAQRRLSQEYLFT